MKKHLLRALLVSLYALSVGTAGTVLTAVIWPKPALAAGCGTCSQQNINTCFGGCDCKESTVDQTWSCKLPTQ